MSSRPKRHARMLRLAALLVFSVWAPALAAGPTVTPPDQTAIRTFVTRIFSGYVAEQDAPPWDRAFTPPMRRLIARNRQLNRGIESEALGADPICGCQDWKTIHITGIVLVRRPDGKVLATVRFTNFGPSTRVFVIARTQHGWRLDDVLERGRYGLRNALISDNKRLSAGQRR